MLLVQGRGEKAFLPAVSEVLLHYNAVETGTWCSDVSIG